MDLQGQVAVVTGAGRGIGRAIALALGDAGADCVLAARSVPALKEVAEALEAKGRRGLVVPTDLRDSGSIENLARQVHEEFGRVDVLVNNSGIGGPTLPLWEIEPADWEETFEINVTGMFLVCRSFLPAMIERQQGSIINIGSISGKRPLLNRTPYAASKLAVVGLTRTLATEVGPHGIRVNVISPGAVEGERIAWVLEQQAEAQGITVEDARQQFEQMSPLRRLVDPNDVANAAVFLASDAAGAITGEDLNVTTGIVMHG